MPIALFQRCHHAFFGKETSSRWDMSTPGLLANRPSYCIAETTLQGAPRTAAMHSVRLPLPTRRYPWCL